MTGIRVHDELGDGPCGFCIHFKRCRDERLACGVFVVYTDPAMAPDWALSEVGRQPSKLGYDTVFNSRAL
jgi:hypothetical protein